MHIKAQKRIEKANNTPTAKKSPVGVGVYGKLKIKINTLCDDALEGGKLTHEETRKVVWLRSRLEIEL